MKRSRRDVLLGSGLGLVGLLAGCQESSSEATPRESDPTPVRTTERRTTVPRSFEGLGETAVLHQGGNARLEITPTEARFEDLLVSARSGSILTHPPGDPEHSFLLLRLELENTGEESVETPADVALSIDGRQYDAAITSQVPGPSYDPYTDLHAGASTSGWVVFEVPPVEREATVLVDPVTIRDVPPTTWTLDLGGVPRQTYDYDGLSAGEGLEWGTDTTNYRFEVTGTRSTRGYTYDSGDTQFAVEPEDGNKFVLVGLRAANTGETAVRVPRTRDTSLLVDSSQLSAQQYRAEDGYVGGEIAPEVVREGVVQFELPAAVTFFDFRVALSGDVVASWNLNV